MLCFAKFLISCFATFYSNFVKFRKIQNNFVKILCFAKILQCCFAATLGRSEEEEEGETGGEGGGLPSAPSPLTQIVPNSASIYSVFHSVNYNSVGAYHSWASLLLKVTSVKR